MESLASPIRELQRLLLVTNPPLSLDTPFIAVVGAQSSGKFSVIELIAGRDFLPRNTELLAQRPLIINLRSTPLGPDFALFDHSPEKKFTSFGNVRTALAALLAESEPRFPVALTIYSTRFVDVSLICLPEAHSDFKALSKANCVILSVASEDFEIFKAVHKIDPNSERTVRVITRPSIEFSYGECINLGNDILNRKKLVSDKENLCDTYSIGIKKEITSKDLLMNKLCSVIKSLLKRCLPNYKLKLTKALQEKHKELKELEEKALNSDTVLKVISKFVDSYKAAIDGESGSSAESGIQGGARISLIFQEKLELGIERIDPLEGLSNEAVGVSIANARSVHPTFFIPEKAFESLARKQILLLLEPSLTCMRMVANELASIVADCKIPEFAVYKLLKQQAQDVMLAYLKKCCKKTESMIKNIIKIEYDHINVLHPDIVPITKLILSNHRNSSLIIKEDEEGSVGQGEEVEIVKSLLRAYMEVVKKNVTDLVLKSVVVLLVDRSKEEARKELVSALYSRETEVLMVEDAEFTQRKNECRENARRIQSSIEEFGKVMHTLFK